MFNYHIYYALAAAGSCFLGPSMRVSEDMNMVCVFGLVCVFLCALGEVGGGNSGRKCVWWVGCVGNRLGVAAIGICV